MISSSKLQLSRIWFTSSPNKKNKLQVPCDFEDSGVLKNAPHLVVGEYIIPGDHLSSLPPRTHPGSSSVVFFSVKYPSLGSPRANTSLEVIIFHDLMRSDVLYTPYPCIGSMWTNVIITYIDMKSWCFMVNVAKDTSPYGSYGLHSP